MPLRFMSVCGFASTLLLQQLPRLPGAFLAGRSTRSTVIGEARRRSEPQVMRRPLNSGRDSQAPR